MLDRPPPFAAAPLPPVFPTAPVVPQVGAPAGAPPAALPARAVGAGGRMQTSGGAGGWAVDEGEPQFDGRRVFIDLGANCGNSWLAMKDSGGPKYDIAYLWEFNPQLVRVYLRPLEQRESNVRVIDHPAWGYDMNMTFYLDNRDDGKTDAEIMARYPCTAKKVNTRNTPSDSSTFLADQAYKRAGRPLLIEAWGFPAWFKRQGFTKDDRVHLKVDIEGAECSVLDSFMDQGMLCDVSKVMVEWHARMSPDTAKCNEVTLRRLREETAKCPSTEYRKWRR